MLKECHFYGLSVYCLCSVLQKGELTQAVHSCSFRSWSLFIQTTVQRPPRAFQTHVRTKGHHTVFFAKRKSCAFCSKTNKDYKQVK